MTVRRIAVENVKLVYVICASKPFSYENGRSPIVYIGTTKNGISRVSESAAAHAENVLSYHGVSSFEVRIITCTPRKNVKTWTKLERAMIIAFRDKFGEVPLCNGTGTKFEERDEFEYFSRSRINSIIESLTKGGAAEEKEISN